MDQHYLQRYSSLIRAVMATSEEHPRHRIVIIISHLDRMGGAEKNVYDLSSHLNNQGYNPLVIVFYGGEVSLRLQNEGVEVRTIEVRKLFSFDGLGKILNLTSILRDVRPDVVITYHHDADIAGGLAAKLASVPMIISSRRDMGYQLGALHIWYYRLSGFIYDKMLTVSQAVKDEVAQREWINPLKISVIHNGLEIDQFAPNKTLRMQLRQKKGLSSKEIVIVCVASFRPIKGQHYLVRAVSQIRDDCEGVKIIFVGYNDNDYGDLVRNLIKELELDKFFEFCGPVTDVVNYLQIADICVLPSEHEGFSNAVIEAMAAGVPVIAARSGGNPEAIEDGKTGFTFESKNSLDLAEKMKILIQQESVRKRMGEEAMKVVRQKFSVARMIDTYIDEMFV